MCIMYINDQVKWWVIWVMYLFYAWVSTINNDLTSSPVYKEYYKI